MSNSTNNDLFINKFLINRKDRIDRMIHSFKELNKVNLSDMITKINAIVPEDNLKNNLSKYISKKAKENLNNTQNTIMIPTLNSLGCLLSHKKIWEHIVEKNITHSIIIEDDIEIKDNFGFEQDYLRLIDIIKNNKTNDLMYIIFNGKYLVSEYTNFSKQYYNHYNEDFGEQLQINYYDSDSYHQYDEPEPHTEPPPLDYSNTHLNTTNYYYHHEPLDETNLDSSDTLENTTNYYYQDKPLYKTKTRKYINNNHYLNYSDIKHFPYVNNLYKQIFITGCHFYYINYWMAKLLLELFPIFATFQIDIQISLLARKISTLSLSYKNYLFSKLNLNVDKQNIYFLNIETNNITQTSKFKSDCQKYRINKNEISNLLNISIDLANIIFNYIPICLRQ